MQEVLLNLFTLLSSIFKLKNLLYIFQQEEYEIRFFLQWVRENKNWHDLEKKKKLNWTMKARLIYVLALLFFIIPLSASFVYLISSPELLVRILGIVDALLLFVLFWIKPYYYLIVAAVLLKPIDLVTKELVIRRAKNKLKKYPNLKIIGITGSYGKTSVKEFLKTILETKFQVLITPENINTPLGISALIQKTDLSKYDVFLVEMGAYREGDIKKICDLVEPEYGILTGINESHLERFESLENTIKTKFELIESLPKNGKAFVNGDDQNVKENYTKFGNCEQNIYTKKTAKKLQGGENGMEFEISLNSEKLSLAVKALGEHNVTNILGGILMAQELGLNSGEIKKGVENIKAVKHRLEPIFNPNGVIIIDDSYNGNPAGVEAAIHVLKLFKNHRKIFITPGLVELGNAKEKVHVKIGKQLAEVCDLVILIKNSNFPYFIQGFKKGGWRVSKNNYKNEEKLKVFEDSEIAHQALGNILKKGDVILFQNDWTDNYS